MICLSLYNLSGITESGMTEFFLIKAVLFSVLLLLRVMNFLMRKYIDTQNKSIKLEWKLE